MPPRVIFHLLAAALAGLAACAWAQQVPGTEATTRDEIARQRQAVAAELAQQEAACHQRFAVEDCLRRVRSAARERDNLLWRQELELGEAERRARAAQRLQSIEERDGAQHVAPPPSQPPQRNPADNAEREQQARERAAQARQRQAAHAAEQQRRAQEQAERLEQSRQRYEARQQKARERREQHERQRAQEASEGRVPARPLPDPVPGGQ